MVSDCLACPGASLTIAQCSVRHPWRNRKMPTFKFSVFREDKSLAFAREMNLPDIQAVWPEVEACALKAGNIHATFIRVTDDNGVMVLRSGIATALASIAKCPCANCSLKKELDGMASTRIGVSAYNVCCFYGRGSGKNLEVRQFA